MAELVYLFEKAGVKIVVAVRHDLATPVSEKGKGITET